MTRKWFDNSVNCTLKGPHLLYNLNEPDYARPPWTMLLEILWTIDFAEFPK
jgi:hypothetical protein